MIELVVLGSLTLLGLHFFTAGSAKTKAAVGKRKSASPKPRKSQPEIPPRTESGEPEFEMKYMHEDDTVSVLKIGSLRLDQSGGEMMITASCDDMKDGIILKNSRIISCRNLRTGRAIKDLGRYCKARSTRA